MYIANYQIALLYFYITYESISTIYWWCVFYHGLSMVWEKWRYLLYFIWILVLNQECDHQYDLVLLHSYYTYIFSRLTPTESSMDTTTVLRGSQIIKMNIKFTSWFLYDY